MPRLLPCPTCGGSGALRRIDRVVHGSADRMATIRYAYSLCPECRGKCWFRKDDHETEKQRS